MYQKHIVCLFSCDYFTFLNIDFDGYYKSLELRRVNSDRNIFSKKCGTPAPFLFRIFTPNFKFLLFRVGNHIQCELASSIKWRFFKWELSEWIKNRSAA